MRFLRMSIVAVVLGASFFWVACSDDSSTNDAVDPSGEHTAVQTMDDLGLCSKKSKGGDPVYVVEKAKYVVCKEGVWSEVNVDNGNGNGSQLNIYAEADDTIPSISFLPNCGFSYESDVYFIASLNSYMRCNDYEWEEYTPEKVTKPVVNKDTIKYMSSISSYKCTRSNEGSTIYVSEEDVMLVCESSKWVENEDWVPHYSSSSYSSSSRRGRSSSSAAIRRVDVLGPCSADEENQIAMDSNGVLDISVTDMYVCHSGLWVAASKYYLDTRGWNDTTSGVIREGQWSAFTYKSKSSKCDAKASAYTYQPYTFDDKWRVADSLELCFGLSCTSNEVGKMYTWNSYSYLCNGIKWVATSLYQMGELHYLNSLKTYGTLHDARDGHDYKTIEIGDQVWMAENLNYADSIESPVLQDGNSFCFGYKDTTCAIGGRIYYWASAMNLINTYNNKVASADLVGAIEPQGLCPKGWHVPDSTEWITLYNSVSKKGSSLKGAGAWTFYADSIVADNASGFSAIPSGYGNTNGGIGVRFCSASQGYYSDEFRSFSLTNSSNNLLINSSDKDDGCFLRCVKNTLDVDVSSSSEVNLSDSPAPQSSDSPAPESSDSPVPGSSDSPAPESSDDVASATSALSTESSEG